MFEDFGELEAAGVHQPANLGQRERIGVDAHFSDGQQPGRSQHAMQRLQARRRLQDLTEAATSTAASKNAVSNGKLAASPWTNQAVGARPTFSLDRAFASIWRCASQSTTPPPGTARASAAEK